MQFSNPTDLSRHPSFCDLTSYSSEPPPFLEIWSALSYKCGSQFFEKTGGFIQMELTLLCMQAWSKSTLGPSGPSMPRAPSTPEGPRSPFSPWSPFGPSAPGAPWTRWLAKHFWVKLRDKKRIRLQKSKARLEKIPLHNYSSVIINKRTRFARHNSLYWPIFL